MLPPDAWVPLAEVMRPHGVRGEVRLRPFNRDSDLLLDVDEVLVRFPEGDGQEVNVDGARRANEAILVKLHSVDDRDRADELRGAVLCVRRGEFPALAQGEFYACDVEGARVVLGAGAGPGASGGERESEGGERELGRVMELRSYPSVDVLVVAAADGGRAWEVPLVEAIVEHVDVSAGVVTLKTLEGVERE
jgi:16S rRNA processing protein RimM